jgi:hypothetical protein
VRELYPEYEPPTEAPLLYDREAAAEDRRRAERARAEFERRTEHERRALSVVAANLIPEIELSQPRQQELVAELAALLTEVRWEWRSRRKIIPDVSLRVLGGVQPTRGEMHVTLGRGLGHVQKLRNWYRSLLPTPLPEPIVPLAEDNPVVGIVIERLAETLASKTHPTLKPGLRLAEKLRNWYRSLPPALLKTVVLFLDERPVLGVVIERLVAILAGMADQYQAKPGRQPGERAAAQGAARWLIWFMNRHVPDASIKLRRSFMFRSMREPGIPCPNLADDPGDFNKWFDEVEALARPATRDSATTTARDSGT